jgi:hypothetical protein
MILLELKAISCVAAVSCRIPGAQSSVLFITMAMLVPCRSALDTMEYADYDKYKSIENGTNES